jgi:hypothetical protein
VCCRDSNRQPRSVRKEHEQKGEGEPGAEGGTMNRRVDKEEERKGGEIIMKKEKQQGD